MAHIIAMKKIHPAPLGLMFVPIMFIESDLKTFINKVPFSFPYFYLKNL